MKIDDIPRFFNPPSYRVHAPWNHIENMLDQYDDREIAGSLGLNLDPDFQRGHVWSEDKQIAFVEYCLKGGQSSRDLFFNHPNWMGSYAGEMTLVDGKQRLEAVRRFVRDDLAIFDGHKLSTFDRPGTLLRGTHAHLIFNVNNLPDRKSLLEWYLQLNDGGVVHTKSELNKVRKLLEKEQSA